MLRLEGGEAGGGAGVPFGTNDAISVKLQWQEKRGPCLELSRSSLFCRPRGEGSRKGEREGALDACYV